MNSPVLLRLAHVAATAALAEAAGRDWLSDSERARLDAITAPSRRAQFLAGRWLLRQLLAGEHGGDALRDWSLTAEEDGPPRIVVKAPLADDGCVALSHSGDWVVCAASSEPVGLDIETPRRARDVLALARAVCTEAEQALLASLEGADRQAHFRVIWTLKEAWLKQRAEGISPGRLASLHTQQAADATANARVWQSAELTLALVAAPLDLMPRWSGEALGLAQASPSHWCVSEVVRNSGDED